MKITKFSFEDKASEWRLEELSFNKLTLLVGASGVGKTQILRALMNLKEIAEGQSFNGIAWFVEFEIIDNQHNTKNYIWEGEFEKSTSVAFFSNKNTQNHTIIREKLTINDKKIVDRNSKKIIYDGKETPKLLPNESIISLLRNEDAISIILENLKKIKYLSYNGSNLDSKVLFYQITEILPSFLESMHQLDKMLNTLSAIQNSDVHINIKLFFLSEKDKKTFEHIKNRFIDIFPNVEDIKFAFDKNNEFPFGLGSFPMMQIKEKNVKNWIGQNKISSGMYSTFMQLSELYLCAEGTIFLIDEFENSLGSNCIDEITADILQSNRQLQFILTSHHPYIINKININNWKLITRNGGVVKEHKMNGLVDIEKSRHSAFMQLVQLEEYQTGQEQL